MKGSSSCLKWYYIWAHSTLTISFATRQKQLHVYTDILPHPQISSSGHSHQTGLPLRSVKEGWHNLDLKITVLHQLLTSERLRIPAPVTGASRHETRPVLPTTTDGTPPSWNCTVSIVQTSSYLVPPKCYYTVRYHSFTSL
ncbi:hypothetical protein BD410DRAFT_399300 [Rickenella mellea]|uniref:Uncharacterized protein n=1 Tax=Rickenella mellea TaxID=50990 RepID=A0A4Y7PGD5_9AGAM|nr:hypothetical protein BD410DRAFT_399300 [Rickenella mellea]